LSILKSPELGTGISFAWWYIAVGLLLVIDGGDLVVDRSLEYYQSFILARNSARHYGDSRFWTVIFNVTEYLQKNGSKLLRRTFAKRRQGTALKARNRVREGGFQKIRHTTSKARLWDSRHI
jgi:hypothetical protein